MTSECAIGIDIGGTSTKLGLIAKSGEVLNSDTIPTLCNEGASAFVAELMNRVETLLQHGPHENRGNAGIALSVAGLIDSRRDRVVYNPNLQSLVGTPLVEIFNQRFKCPVVLDADCNAACLGELRFGAGQGAKRLLSFVVGTGLGVGFAADGHIVRVSHQCLGDAGHVIVQPGGPLCSSGCHGCAEAFVSASTLESKFQNASGNVLKARKIIELAIAGDKTAGVAVEEIGHWLGVAIASLATIFFPDRVVVSGGLSEAGQVLLEPAIRSFRECAAPSCSDGVVVRQATLGWRAGMIGAAAMLL